MLSVNNIITKLLGLKDIFITSLEENDFSIFISIETSAKDSICPRCGTASSLVPDYCTQQIKDLSIRGNLSTCY